MHYAGRWNIQLFNHFHSRICKRFEMKLFPLVRSIP